MTAGRAGSILIIALGLAIASGCTLLKPVNEEVRKETLTAVPLDLAHGPTHRATLLIFAPAMAEAYDTTRMAYESHPHEIAYFTQTEWAERPSEMIQALILQVLQRARYFDEVVSPPFMNHYTHTLRTQVLAFQQDFTSEPATFVVSLRVEFAVEATRRLVGVRDISVREPMQERTAHAGAIAANDAMTKALKELAEFVRAGLAQERNSGRPAASSATSRP